MNTPTQISFNLLKFTVVLMAAVLLQISNAYAAETEAVRTYDQTAVMEAVQNEFTDVPAMIEIARCESKFRQFTDSGNVFYGGYNNQMVGVFQFYESIHNSAATALDYDLATLDGNIAYARHLYEAEGLTPWNSSKSCWEDAQNEVPTETANPTRTELEAKIAKLKEIIALLTTILELKSQLALR